MVAMHRMLLLVTLISVLPAVTAANERDAPVIRCELAVIGGGSAGFGAAFAAARLGVDVVLVERADCLGGNSVRSGVNCWEMGAGGTGIPFDLYRRLKSQSHAVGIYSFSRHLLWYDPQLESYRYPGGETVIDPGCKYRDTLRRYGSRGMAADEAFCREHWHGVPFEPDAMAGTMLAMLRETRHCRVLLKTAFVAAEANSGHIESVELSDGSRLAADYYVDATGDGVVCIAAGCQFQFSGASSCRLSRTMMQLGQAAGTATGLAKKLGVSIPDVPPVELRKALRQQHVQLSHPMSAAIRQRLEQE